MRAALRIVTLAAVLGLALAPAGASAKKAKRTCFEHITIAGRFVAYAAYSDCAADYCNPNAVMVQDLRSGRRTFAEGTLVAVAHVSDLVLASDGAVAWIQTSFDDNGSVRPGLHVVAGGAPTARSRCLITACCTGGCCGCTPRAFAANTATTWFRSSPTACTTRLAAIGGRRRLGCGCTP